MPFREERTLGGYRGVATCYTATGKGGLASEDIEALCGFSRTFALVFRTLSEVVIGRTLLQTYLGADAAERVLAGRIRRGQAESLRTVLWSSDLRGFTRIADHAPRDELLPFLDAYAEIQVDSIERHGGQVLKFIGDGILAMFDTERTESAFSMALDAAEEVRARVGELTGIRRAEGRPTTDVYIGLHVGEVLYGNIGSPQRLDFTVIGPAVNEVSRIENMCRAIDQPVVVSSAFASADADAARRLVSLGRYALRGVARPQELFTLDPEPQAG
ncbi:MAG: adenylate/guanylate cyclase domain-containing protein [Geminicoccaceae bacterium]